jgi:4-hydroxy-3-polyprenylbenzoate decarboxylase
VTTSATGSAIHPQPGATPARGSPARPRRFVLGISGASGAAYALRLLEQLLVSGAEVHLVVTDYGRRLLFDEERITHLEFASLCPTISDARVAQRLVIHPNKDVGAVIASGSFLHDGMAVLPCSSNTLGALAGGAGGNLLARAAMVTLKERRTLVVCHREMPLNHIDIENMRRLSLAGGIVCPTNPGFYLKPTKIEDLVDFVVGKVLDLLKVEHGLGTRWEERREQPGG